MLMSVCWSCGDIKVFTRTEELYLLITYVITCPCGAENAITEELRENIKKDWGMKL